MYISLTTFSSSSSSFSRFTYSGLLRYRLTYGTYILSLHFIRTDLQLTYLFTMLCLFTHIFIEALVWLLFNILSVSLLKDGVYHSQHYRLRLSSRAFTPSNLSSHSQQTYFIENIDGSIYRV